MVVGILIRQIAPANRGLARRSGSEIAAATGINNWPASEAYDRRAYRNLNVERGHQVDVTDPVHPDHPSARSRRQKPFRAMAMLTSMATDLDLITDWVFYADTVRKDEEYREQYRRHPIAGEPPYLVPPLLKQLVLASCILGTIMWLVITSDGRVLAPGLRLVGIDNLSIGFILFICVLIEDIPQVVLTFLVEDYFEDGRYFSSSAVCNLMTSVYDSVIKMAEAFDERGDIVETGVWCKKSIWAHYNTVTAVQIVPFHQRQYITMQSERSPSASNSSGNLSQASSERQLKTQSGSERQVKFQSERLPSKSYPERPSLKLADPQKRPPPIFLQEGILPITQTQLPRLRFLTTSLDKTIRLWDTENMPQQRHRDKSMQTYRGHTEGVNCICLMESLKVPKISNPENTDLPSSEEDEADDHTTYFLTGCRNGNTKLWSLNGECIRSFYLALDTGNAVNSIANIREGVTFACGHRDGSARLWEAWSGVCLGRYLGHTGQIFCLCSLLDGQSFITGAEDEMLRLWDTNDAMQALKSYDKFQDVVVEVTNRRQLEQSAVLSKLPWRRAKMATSRFLSERALYEERVCVKTFLSHSAPVLCVTCLQPGVAFVSGSADCTARIWFTEEGKCARVLPHPERVSAVTAIDSATILTGCYDKIVRVWDALSGSCLRNFSGHEDYITSICLAGGDVFLTSSADQTVKIWVLTTVPQSPQVMFDSIMEDGNVCRPGMMACI